MSQTDTRHSQKVSVKSIQDLREKVSTIRKGNPEHGFMFRGMRARDDLSTTLERACQAADIPPQEVPEFERRILREFKRRYHHYSAHVPAMDHDIEWLALMQHHGAPTRLLDWTYSLEVAIYFALKHSLDARTHLKSSKAAGHEAAVWMMDAHWATIETAKKFRQHDNQKAADFVLRPLESPDDQAEFGRAFLAYSVPCACSVNPYRLNERLTIQHGVFVCPGDVTVSFEENLQALPQSDCAERVVAFIIPPSEIQPGLEALHDSNISDATLFPGLDGFARSLSVNIRCAPPRTRLPREIDLP